MVVGQLIRVFMADIHILYLSSLYVCAHTLFTWLNTIPVTVIALDYWSQCIL